MVAAATDGTETAAAITAASNVIAKDLNSSKEKRKKARTKTRWEKRITVKLNSSGSRLAKK